MKRTSFAKWPCSIARTVDLIGDGWTPIVLREAFYGTTRFDDFERVLGIGRNVLSQRLVRLVEEGLMERQAYQQNPPRYDYVVTQKGRELFPVLAAMMAWGDRWLAPNGPPLLFRHDTRADKTPTPRSCAASAGSRWNSTTSSLTSGRDSPIGCARRRWRPDGSRHTSLGLWPKLW